jgi:hypothetical protein
MKQQLAFDFNAVHQFENNSNNQSHLEMKREDFNEQCWTVLKRMLEGERLSYLTAINTGIGDIRRRAKDLIDSYGIPVKREWDVKDGEKQDYKVYYIAPEDRESVMKRIIDWMKN